MAAATSNPAFGYQVEMGSLTSNHSTGKEGDDARAVPSSVDPTVAATTRGDTVERVRQRTSNGLGGGGAPGVASSQRCMSPTYHVSLLMLRRSHGLVELSPAESGVGSGTDGLAE